MAVKGAAGRAKCAKEVLQVKRRQFLNFFTRELDEMKIIIEENDTMEQRQLAEALLANKLVRAIEHSDGKMEFNPDKMYQRLATALRSLEASAVILHRYDYSWIMTAINDGAIKGVNQFKSPQKFIDYLREIGIKDVPSRTTLSTWNGCVLEHFPQWSFADSPDMQEICRRKNIVYELISKLN